MRILHSADLHMDSPFEGLSPEKAAARRAEQRQLLSRIAELSNEKCVDAVLICGDLFDSDNSYYETGEELVRCFRQINAPIFIVPGNHDYYCRKSPYEKVELPRNVHVFIKNKMEYLELENKKCKIYGGAYISRENPRLLEGFRLDDSECINIVLAHGDFGEEEIAYTNADYLALGHIHKPTGLRKAGKTYFSQPGCPEGRGFDEAGDRFVNIVDIEKESCSLEQVKISSRKYEILNVDVTGIEPLLAIKMAIPDNTVRDIYRIVLTGEVDTPVDTKSIKESLSEYFYEVQIRDETKTKTDIWEKCSDDTLRGIFLSKLKAQLEEAETDADRKLIEQSVRWGLAAMDNMEEYSLHGN